MPTRQVLALFLLTAIVPGCAEPSGKPRFEQRQVTLPNGDSLHYVKAGDRGDTVLVLAGGPAWSSEYLHAPLFELAENHVLLFLDLAGRGKSSALRDSVGPTVDRDLADLFSLTAVLGLGRITLAGHGYGAGLAAMYALHHPDQISRLVLVSPMFTDVNLVWQASFQPNDSVATARFLVAKRLGRDTVDAAGFCRGFWGFDLSPVEETDSLIVRQLAEEICSATPPNLETMGLVSRGIRRSLGSWNWRDSLHHLAQPALIVQGDRNLFLKRTGQIWSELLPNATFAPIKGPSHFPWLEQGDEFRRVVGDFLSAPRLTADTRSPTRDRAVTPPPLN